MAELQFPNFLATQIAGYQAGQQMANDMRTARDQNALRQLAPQIIAGDPNAYAQAATINPEVAQKYDEAGTAPLKKFQGLVSYMDRARATGNQNAVNAALREAAPLITRMTGKPAPTEWTPEMDAGWEQLKAKVAMAGQSGELPTGFRQFQMTAEAAGLVPGTPEYQQAANIALGREGRASNAGFGFELIEGADGRKRLQRNNPRTGAAEIYDEATGDFVPLGGAQSPSAPQGVQAFMAADGRPVQIDPTLPPNVQAAARQEAMTGQPMPAQIPGLVMPPAANPGLAVSRRPEDEAAATEAAKRQIELTTLPQELGMRTDAAVREAGGVAAARTTAEAQAKIAEQQGKRTRDANETIRLLDEADRLLPQATSGGLAELGKRGAAFVGRSTEGAKADAALNLLAAKLVANVPRFEGPQSNIDVQFYREAAGDLANPNLPRETRMAAAQQMRRLQEKYATPAPQPPAGERRARNPQTGQVLVLRNGQWVPEG